MDRATPAGRSPQKVDREFPPSRLQQECLIGAYEVLVPTWRTAVRTGRDAVSGERSGGLPVGAAAAAAAAGA